MTTENNALAFSAVFLSRNPLTDEKISQLAAWGKKLMQGGLVKNTEGNVSYRTKLGFIISGTNIALDALTPETVAEVTGVVYGLNKNSVYVKGAVVPSSETVLHAQIYDFMPEINAIFHCHDDLVMTKAVLMDIPVTSKEQAAGSQALAEEAVNLLNFNKGTHYFVLKNHGVVAIGATMDEAGGLMEEMRAKVTAKPAPVKKPKAEKKTK